MKGQVRISQPRASQYLSLKQREAEEQGKLPSVNKFSYSGQQTGLLPRYQAAAAAPLHGRRSQLHEERSFYSLLKNVGRDHPFISIKQLVPGKLSHRDILSAYPSSLSQSSMTSLESPTPRNLTSQTSRQHQSQTNLRAVLPHTLRSQASMKFLEDESAKKSHEGLSRLTTHDERKLYTMPRSSVDISQFKLHRNYESIPQIKQLLCGFIDTHKKLRNKDVVCLPHYERTAPFAVETMKFADSKMEDRNRVQKTYGYDEDNLQRNNLLLEKIILERILKTERDDLKYASNPLNI